MGGDWRQATLRDFLTVKHGYAFEGRYFSDEAPGPILLTPGNFRIGGGFNPQAVRYFKGDVPRGYELLPGDLVVTMTDLSKAGDTLGYSARIPNDGLRYLYNQRVGKIAELSTDLLSLDFAYWLLRSPDYRAEVLASATGSTVRHTSPSRIQAFRFCRPTLPEQLNIAELLNSLEDKIELNRRMAETLEAMAHALFKSWFVDFDPVHARAEGRPTGLPDDLAALFPDSFGESHLPKGWSRKPLSEAFTLTMGQSPPGSTYNKEGHGPPFFQGRTDFDSRYPINRVFCSSPSRLAEPGDTLVSVRAPVGSISMAKEECCLGRGVAALRHKSGYSTYTYYSALGLQPSIAAFDDTGTVFGSINRKQLESLILVEPDRELISAFNLWAETFDKRIEMALGQISTLCQLRDALLPKLISGELRIAHAEHRVAAA